MSLNKAQLIIFGSIGIVVLVAVLVIFGVIPGLETKPPKPVTLTVWALDDDELWQAVGEGYRQVFPHVTVSYVKKDRTNYEKELLNALAAGRGPDIFVLNNSEIPEHKEKITPLPSEELAFRPRDFKETFFNAAFLDLVTPEGQILGIPLALDTLALFYNRDIFNSANIAAPPKTWEELVLVAERLTAFTEVGTISRSGIALGTASNVLHSTDILAALMLQAGTAIVDRKTLESALLGGRGRGSDDNPAQTALQFYTSFADPKKKSYSWSGILPESLTAFAQGKAAMAIGYAGDVPEVSAKNPHLNFDVSQFPQPADAETRINYARYDFYTVSKQSQSQSEAWQLLLWLAAKEQDGSVANFMRLAPSRRDLIESRPPMEYLSVFYGQVLSAKTWLIPDRDKTRQIFTEMINSVVSRQSSVSDAIRRAHERLNDLLKQPTL